MKRKTRIKEESPHSILTEALGKIVRNVQYPIPENDGVLSEKQKKQLCK